MNYILIPLCLLTMGVLSAQDLPLSWAKGMEGGGFQQGNSLTVDNEGNIYITGRFEGTVDFDPGPDTFNLVSAGGHDIFIQKLSPAGNLVWVKSIGGVQLDGGNAIASDNEGNIYIAGEFRLTVDFDPGPDSYTVTTVTGNSDAFLLKLNTAGNFIWVKVIKGSGSAQVNALYVVPGGAVILAGEFTGTADFDNGSGGISLTSAGGRDLFICKVGSSGNGIWAKSMGGAEHDDVEAITLAADGSIYATGYFNGTADFDPGPEVYPLISAGRLNVFVLKLDPAGNFVWAKRIGGASVTGTDAWAIAVDPWGNVLTAGGFSGTVDFDPGPGTFPLTSTGTISGVQDGHLNIFIQKLNAAGEFSWAVKMGGAGLSRARAMFVDAEGSIYTTGEFHTTGDFDPGPGTFNLTATALVDKNSFISKLTAGGEFVWANSIAGSSSNQSYAMTKQGSDLYITGYYWETADFDPGPDTYQLTSAGSGDIFVAKYSTGDCPVSTTSLSVSHCTGYIFNNQTYTQSGVYTHTLTNAAGCDSIIILNLAVDNAPAASFTWNQPAGFLVEFTSTSQNGDTYEWIFTDANGQTTVSNAENPTFTYLFEGTYPVTLTVTNECGSHTITVNVIVEKRVGINDLPGIEASIWSNPASGNFFLHLRQLHPEQVSLNVYGLTGQRVHSRIIPPSHEQTVQIDPEDWAGGIYILQLVIPRGQLNRKIIVGKNELHE